MPNRVQAEAAIAAPGECCTLQTALATAVSGDEIWVMQAAQAQYEGDRNATFQLKSGVGCTAVSWNGDPAQPAQLHHARYHPAAT